MDKIEQLRNKFEEILNYNIKDSKKIKKGRFHVNASIRSLFAFSHF